MVIFMFKPKPFPVLLSHNIICRFEDAPRYCTLQSLHISSSFLFPEMIVPVILSQKGVYILQIA